jgi:hypothetical protein
MGELGLIGVKRGAMMKKGFFTVQNFLRFSLVFVLIGSLRHVAWGFGTLEQETLRCTVLFWEASCSLFWGYFQAIAVDLVVIALAYGIEQRKKATLPTGWYWVGMVGFVLVSTYANLLYGLVFSSAVAQSGDWPKLSEQMVYLKPFVLSGVLPIMLVYISHITAGSQAASVTVSRPELKAAWVRSIIDHWQQSRQRIPTPTELVRVYGQETGQVLTVQEATGFLTPQPVVQVPVLPEPMPETEQVAEPTDQIEQSGLTDQEINRRLVRFYKDELGLSWVKVAEKMGKSKTTVIGYYNAGKEAAEVATNGRVK